MFKTKKSKLQITQVKVQSCIKKTNKAIKKLGDKAKILYDKLTEIQDVFDAIRNVASSKKLKYKELKKIKLGYKQQVKEIADKFKKVEATDAKATAVMASSGIAIAAAGPSMAMGIATTFGVASTGTAISSLSGAVATKAALAWIGGGALTAGGGGIAAGKALLALAGPVGWTIVGVALLAGGLFFWKTKGEHDCVENILVSINRRDIKSYDLAVIELNERIYRMVDETIKLNDIAKEIKTFGHDYRKMSEEQQYKLGSYVNLMSSSTQLLVSPIYSLYPKYTLKDFKQFISSKKKNAKTSICKKYKDLIISLANFLYAIDLNDKEKQLLWKSMRNNTKVLKSIDISKKEFEKTIFDAAYEAQEYKNIRGRGNPPKKNEKK